MTLKAVQLSLSTTSQAAIVQGSGAGQFMNVAGNARDPLPVQIANIDPAITIYVGGPDVSASLGMPIAPGASWTANLYGTSEIPWLVAASGTPKAAVLLGRQ